MAVTSKQAYYKCSVIWHPIVFPRIPGRSKFEILSPTATTTYTPKMFDFIYDYVERELYIKYLRLTIIVGAYVIFRAFYAKWAQQKQIKRQLELDQKEKAEKPEREKKAKEDKESELKREAAAFGWGKKTRKHVKLTETKLEEELTELRERHQSAYDAAEDHDIDYLLED